jgi:tetratricopeptide (TPR) repeat protein
MIGSQFVEFFKLLFREFGPRWFPFVPVLAIIGSVQLFKRDRVIFWFLALVALADIGYGVSYIIAEDKDAYYLPAFLAFAITAAFGLRWLIGLVVSKRESVMGSCLTTAVIVLVIPACTLAANWPFDNRRHYFIAHDYVENILGPMEHGSLLLTLDWQVASPMLYTRDIEHLRPDVKVVDVNLLRRLWYFDYLKRAYPELVERSREEVDSFVAELKQWDADPKAYAKDAILAQSIDSKFQNMLISFVTKEMAVAPVYATSDVVFQTGEQDKELRQWLTTKYQLVPRGLAFKLETDRAFHEPPPLHLKIRGLADGTLKFEPDDVVMLKVLPAYKTMLVNRGRYLSVYGRYERAAEAFKSALTLDPKLELARKGLNESLARLPR